MPITKQRTLDYVNIEWGGYVERFRRLPSAEQEKRVKAMGYESFRDLQAHILEWWDEGMGIIRAVAEGRKFERKKYDFDVFNAQAVAKYKAWDEPQFMEHFEKTRQGMGSELKSMREEAYDHRRVQSWIHAVIIHHAREHLSALSRFLTMDLLQNEWAEYIADFNALDEEKKGEFLSKQGFETFHDLLAHIVGWWEEGARIITGILSTPGLAWESREVDEFNAELTKKYASWSDDDMLRHFDSVRRAMIDLTADLPEDAFMNEDIEGWLRDDVVEHYDEHPLY